MNGNIQESEPRTRRRRTETLCFSCSHAIRKVGEHDCPWAWSFTPVNGWVAEPTKIKIRESDDLYSDSDDLYIDSYMVIECPMYECDEPEKISIAYCTQNKSRHCKLCLNFECTKRAGRRMIGVCHIMNGERRVTGSMTCIGFEEADDKRMGATAKEDTLDCPFKGIL